MKRHAVAGSTVNPATIGHLRLLEALAFCGLFDVIHWIPTGERPDKRGVVDSKHRRAMTNLLVEDLALPYPLGHLGETPDVEVIVHFDDIDGANTPSIEWMERLQRENLGDKFFWVTGSDSIMPKSDLDGMTELETRWVRGAELARDWPIVVVPRSDYPLPNPADKESRRFYERFRHLIFLTTMLSDVSSTEVRRRIKSGERYGHLVISPVAEYIQKHRLYGG